VKKLNLSREKTMNSLHVVAIGFMSLCIPSASHANNCSDVLTGGTFSTLNFKSNNYARLVLAARLATMTKSEADTKYSAAGNLPDVPIGGNFSSEDFSKWQNSVKSSLDIDQITQNETAILVSSGDPTIVNAWESCMNSKGGLAAKFERLDDTNVILAFTYYAYPGQGGVKLSSDVEVIGAGAGYKTNNLIEGTELVPGVSRQIAMTRASDKPMLAIFNTSTGAARAYLPALKKIPIPPYFSRTKDVPVYSGYARASRNVTVSTAENAPLTINFNPGEEPTNLSDLLSNIKVVGGSITGNGDSSPTKIFDNNNILIMTPSWDPGSRVLSAKWDAGLARGDHAVSEYNMQLTIRVAYRMKNPDAN
jgi:hypothetical protein